MNLHFLRITLEPAEKMADGECFEVTLGTYFLIHNAQNHFTSIVKRIEAAIDSEQAIITNESPFLRRGYIKLPFQSIPQLANCPTGNYSFWLELIERPTDDRERIHAGDITVFDH